VSRVAPARPALTVGFILGCLPSLLGQHAWSSNPSLSASMPMRLAALPQSRSRQSSLVIVAAGTVSTNDFKNGLTVELEGVPYRVIGECKW
jgi:hypothetical protein